jgi:hypothetical protein
MAGKFRYFIYLDDGIVSQFLEQLEGGEYDTERIRQSHGADSSVGIGVHHGPIQGNAQRGRSSSSESELDLHQTAASRFSRFHHLAMAEQEAIQHIDACDETIWDQLQVGEVLDVGVSLTIPHIVKALGSLDRISGLMPMFAAVSTIDGEDGQPLIDPSEIQNVANKLPIFQQTAAAIEDSGIPVLASLVGDEKFKFFVRLKRSNLQVEQLTAIEGDVRLVGTIQRLIPKAAGDVEVGQILPGIPSPNRTQRRQGGQKEENAIRLRYPSAVIMPLAVFR